ncbi:prepilin-type N-terminal cleavage/methylation domain-containing protein [Jidongwangia harbinensis]|uniref:prepilin-type N-terminal cleavage/methylation domain-containing protein n=1 Tax=Jidongwangia harbinensis TaxID=2878561 RepID=UPI001CD9DC9D|nr:prepilin-type N-terminal cleavage/methylation domain-containing protein [Jidongwangia harbinensis]MCA2215345.1 prepilin-type N-terminal cleavage/methylation domain-containing protein [Jidongwangia harbinensis]
MSRPAARRDDAGVSLIEVLVSMGVMSIVMALFTTAILQAYRATGKVEKMSIVQSELHRGFQRFDRELRYASWIAQPGTVGTGVNIVYYVEFASANGTECLQLRLEPGNQSAATRDGEGILQLLRWTPGAPPARTARGQTVASYLVVDGTAAPFAWRDPNSTPSASPSPSPSVSASAAPPSDFVPDFQQLRIRLKSRFDGATAQIDTTFTALNTSRSTAVAHPCQEGRPTP